MGLILHGRCSNFAPGVTHVPCCLCGDLVDIRGDSWNEEPKNPAHRLCWNSRRPSYAESLLYDPPLNYYQLAEIYQAIRDGVKFTDEQRAYIKESIRKTAKWECFELPTGEAFNPTRGRAYAIRLLAFIATGLVYEPGGRFRVQSGLARHGP